VSGNSVLKLVALVALVALGEGCTAHAKASAEVNTSVEANDRKYEVPEQESPAPMGTRPPPAPAPLAGAPPLVDRTFFLGVSHDLSLAPGPRPAACRCLAVGYGSPTDPKFAWQEGPPKVEPGTMAVAIAADGVPCSSPGYSPLRASISAVERSGDDIVLVVENVRNGAPTVHGALVASPSGKSTLVVRARRGAPYGAPASGGPGPCRLALQ
jgi:hypothetical protein